MSQAVKVGIFATIVLLLLGYFVLRIEDWNPFGPEGQRVDAVFESVAGLDDRSAVRVAGVRVGRVDGIDLDADGRRALVHLLLERPVELSEEAYARIASLGMLGDKYVALEPGPEEAPPLPEGQAIPGVTPPGFDDAMKTLNEVAESVRGVTDPLGAGLRGTGEETPLSRLIANLEATTAEIRLLVESNRQQLQGTIRNFEQVSSTLARELPRLTAQLEGLLTEVGAVVAENRDAVNTSTRNVAEISEQLKTTVADLNQISGRLARGEGTLGKLLTSEEAHEELVATLDSVQGGVETLSDTLGRVRQLRLDVDMEGWALAQDDESYGRFGFTLFPHEDSKRLYRVALASTPRGEERTKTQIITVTNPDGSTETTRVRTLTQEDQEVLTALVGYRLDSGLRMWTGLIEDDFGAQVEVPFFDRRFWLDLQAFSFDRENDLDPHLRLTGRYWLNDNIYVVGGYDDPLVDEFDSLFVGGGIRWTDDDLKYLLGSVPVGGL